MIENSKLIQKEFRNYSNGLGNIRLSLNNSTTKPSKIPKQQLYVIT